MLIASAVSRRPIPRRPVLRRDSTDALCAVAVLAFALHAALPGVWRIPTVQAWTTVFAAICIQATPYVVLGVVVSAAIAAAPAGWVGRMLPRRAALAVPVAALAGSALPGCECGSVPVAASLLRRGVPPGPALAMMLSAPATNPVVLAATAAAFPGRPGVVLARFAGSFVLSMLAGWLWGGRAVPVRGHQHSGSARDLAAAALHEAARSLGLLTVGAASAATIAVLVPPAVFGALARPLLGVLVLALLAVLLAVCSEADAFIASSLTSFSTTARLAFMVVGPAVDVKLVAMQAGAFGGRVAARLGVLVFVLALPCAAVSAAVFT